MLDLTAGPIATSAQAMLVLARGLWVVMLILALVIEAFGRSPVAPRDFAGCVFRALVILTVLGAYPQLAGSVVRMGSDLEAQVAPADSLEAFARAHQARLTRLQETSAAEMDQSRADSQAGQTGSALGHTAAAAAATGGMLGGYLFESGVALIVLVGEALTWVMGYLARLLVALLYVVGPLALTFSVPRVSNVVGRWFQMLVTVLVWPMISGLLFRLALAIGLDSFTGAGVSDSLGLLVSALLMIAIALCAPALASGLVGGSARNLVLEGASAAAHGLSSAGRTASQWLPHRGGHGPGTPPSAAASQPASAGAAAAAAAAVASAPQD